MAVADSDGIVSVRLVLSPDPETDPEIQDRMIRQLRDEILELDVESAVADGTDTVPAGAKGVDPVTLGALIVALSASGGVFTTLVETLRDWLDRRSAQHRISVTVNGDTIELERASSGDKRDLVQIFIDRHSGKQ